jgi:hypothetical protein
VLQVLGVGMMARNLRAMLTEIKPILFARLIADDESGSNLVARSVTASTSTPLTFVKDVPQAYVRTVAYRSMKASDTTASGAVGQFAAALTSYIELWNGVVDRLRLLISLPPLSVPAQPSRKSYVADPKYLTLSNVSAGVTGSSSIAGQQWMLTFSTTSASDSVPFTFQVTYAPPSRAAATTSVSAILKATNEVVLPEGSYQAIFALDGQRRAGFFSLDQMRARRDSACANVQLSNGTLENATIEASLVISPSTVRPDSGSFSGARAWYYTACDHSQEATLRHTYRGSYYKNGPDTWRFVGTDDNDNFGQYVITQGLDISVRISNHQPPFLMMPAAGSAYGLYDLWFWIPQS